MSAPRGLLLDFGSVISVSVFERHRETEAALSLRAGCLDWLGPLAPETDALWQAMQRDELSERDYWARRAAELGAAVGEPGWDVQTMMLRVRQTDPAAYWDQLATWQDAQIEHQRVLAIQTHQAQAREAAVAQAVDQANHELAQKYPFWSDPQQRREIQQDIISWARTQGYTDQELHGLTSAKYLETLFKASLYDRYQARIKPQADRKSTRLNSSHFQVSRMPSSA